MSLTAFNRVRRLQKVEEMKPENIQKEEVKEIKTEENPVVEKVVEETSIKEEPKITSTTRRRNTSKRK